MPITLDPEVLQVAEYVYNERLSKPYTEVGGDWNYNHQNPTATNARGDGHNLQRSIQVKGKTLHRPIHGLAHTMRTLMYSQLMHEAAKQQQSPNKCKNGQTLADLTDLDLKKLNIAQLFFVAGRESEASYGNAYHRYHLYGAEQFAAYARIYLTHLYSEEEIIFYARCIEDRIGDYYNATPQSHLMHLAHMIDLMRCKAPVEVFLGHTRGVSGIVPTLIHFFGKEKGLDILRHARALFAATGEAVPYIDSSEWYDLGVERERVDQSLKLIGPISAEGKEADADKTFIAGFSVTGCYNALHNVHAPKWYQQAEEEITAQVAPQIDVETSSPQVIEENEEPVRLKPTSTQPAATSLIGRLKNIFWSTPIEPKQDDASNKASASNQSSRSKN